MRFFGFGRSGLPTQNTQRRGQSRARPPSRAPTLVGKSSSTAPGMEDGADGYAPCWKTVATSIRMSGWMTNCVCDLAYSG
jgi:hypothetical protein